MITNFGDPCPAGYCKGEGVVVHQALIPFVDEGGDVVMPQWYGLCCTCYSEQFIVKYGIDKLGPCGCEYVDLQAVARAQRQSAADLAAGKAVVEDARVQEWREQFVRDRQLQEDMVARAEVTP